MSFNFSSVASYGMLPTNTDLKDLSMIMLLGSFIVAT